MYGRFFAHKEKGRGAAPTARYTIEIYGLHTGEWAHYPLSEFYKGHFCRPNAKAHPTHLLYASTLTPFYWRISPLANFGIRSLKPRAAPGIRPEGGKRLSKGNLFGLGFQGWFGLGRRWNWNFFEGFLDGFLAFGNRLCYVCRAVGTNRPSQVDQTTALRAGTP